MHLVTRLYTDSLFNFLLFFVQVNALIVKYNREQITVWGNKSSTIVNKAYALVSTGYTQVLFQTLQNIYNISF